MHLRVPPDDGVVEHHGVADRRPRVQVDAGESTDPETVAPETITPGDTSESAAWPRRPGPACTNFAGGRPELPVNSGHFVL